MFRRLLLLAPITGLFTIALNSCSSNEIGNSRDVSQDKIYQQYSVSFNEGDDHASIHAAFRFAGRNGTTLVLNTPSQISFDGKTILVDSGKYEGAYYRSTAPINGFYGKHHFIFTDINNKKFDNDFSFDTFQLVNMPAVASKKQPLVFSFQSAPLGDDDYIEIGATNTDSSFSITHNKRDGSAISIPAKDLFKQKGNTLTLEVTLNRKIMLQQNTAEGGNMDLQYKLKPVKIKLQ
jgi:hypothetical protein